jgi:16S rRNA (uracil1498-N3)-methyltransferase
VVPLVAERSVVRWDGPRVSKAVERLARVAVQAAAQCRRVWLPEVTVPVTLAQLAATGPVGLCDLGGGPPTDEMTVLATGPEGGWGPGERALGLPTVGLSPLVLRAETAAVAAAAVLGALRDGVVAAPARARPVR